MPGIADGTASNLPRAERPAADRASTDGIGAGRPRARTHSGPFLSELVSCGWSVICPVLSARGSTPGPGVGAQRVVGDRRAALSAAARAPAGRWHPAGRVPGDVDRGRLRAGPCAAPGGIWPRSSACPRRPRTAASRPGPAGLRRWLHRAVEDPRQPPHPAGAGHPGDPLPTRPPPAAHAPRNGRRGVEISDRFGRYRWPSNAPWPGRPATARPDPALRTLRLFTASLSLAATLACYKKRST